MRVKKREGSERGREGEEGDTHTHIHIHAKDKWEQESSVETYNTMPVHTQMRANGQAWNGALGSGSRASHDSEEGGGRGGSSQGQLTLHYDGEIHPTLAK